MGDQGHKSGSKIFGVDEPGPHEDYGDTCISCNPDYQAEQRGFMARDQSPVDFPVLTRGPLCPICKGTTFVIRADKGLELEEPLTPAVVPCDNPLCPHLPLGVRTIRSLGFPNNHFNYHVQMPTGRITAVKEE